MNIYHLVKSLRSRAIAIENIRDIIVLTTAEVTEEEWSALAIFPRISLLMVLFFTFFGVFICF